MPNYNYTGNPYDPYGDSDGGSSWGNYGDTGENTYVPPGSGQDSATYIPVNNDPGVVGSSTYDPSAANDASYSGIDFTNLGGNTGGIPIDPDGLGAGSQGGGYGTSSGGSFGNIMDIFGDIFGGGQNGGGGAIPIPGLSWPAAIGADILLNNGNIFGGGGGGPPSIGGVVDNVTNAVTNPGQAISNVGDSLNNIMGPTSPGGGLGQASAGAILTWPTGGGNGGGSTPSQSVTAETPPGAAPNAPTDNGGGSVPSVLPGGPTGADIQAQNQAHVLATQTPADSGYDPGQTAVVPTNVVQSPTPTEHNIPAPTNVVPTPSPGPYPTNPTSTPGSGGGTTTGDLPATTPPVIPGGTTGTGGGVTTVPPLIPSNTTTMPTPPLPDPRNYYNEGNQSSNDLSRLWPQIAQLYGNASGAYGNTDYANYNNIANQFGGSNGNLTNIANQQTIASNNALRQANLNDVAQFSGQARDIRNNANPNLYGQNGALTTYQRGLDQQLQYAQNRQADAGNLSPEDVRNSQQAAREAWSARGLVYSPGAVGDEILNRSALTQQRQQQAFQNTNTALNNYQGAVQAQQANVFDPYSTILGAQYGQQTTNAGNNANLFGQASGFSSGAQGNQFVQNAFNPYNNYAQDVYNTNYNAANAQYIGGQNNAAALQGANTAANSNILSNFLGSLAGAYGRGVFSCWVAVAVFGEDSPKVQKFRRWMLTRGPRWFRDLYVAHGERFAAWLNDGHDWLKAPIRAFMNSKIKALIEEDHSYAGAY